MADSAQITVNLVELEKSEKDLADLSKKMANRYVKVQFINAKGLVADNMIAIASQLNEFGLALTDLIQKTEIAVAKTRVSFTGMDNSLAQWWGTGE